MAELIADAVSQDQEIHKAFTTILQRVETYQQKITTIKPASSNLKANYEKTLDQFVELRGMPLWHPYLGSGFGNGALVELADGSVKYDFISGIAVHWGHCHPDIVKAQLEASIQNTVMQGQLQQNRDSYALTQLLVESSGMNHCILTTSGAMACENALKLVLQHKSPANRILALEGCFVGRTLTLSQITDKPDFRQGLPLNQLIDYIPFYDWRDPKGSTQKAQEALRKVIKRYPKQHACMCFELIQGEAGYYPGTREYFLSLMTILKEQDIPVFVDEVQSFGRTDHLFAFQHFGLENYVDVVTAGKLLHVCATLYSSKLRPRPGLISQTFTGATSSIRAAVVILNSLKHDGYLGREGKNMQLGKLLMEKLEKIASRHPTLFEGPFGLGLLVAFTPFQGEREKVIHFAKVLFDKGVIVFVAGADPTRIRMVVPAGSVQESDIEMVAGLIEETLIT